MHPPEVLGSNVRAILHNWSQASWGMPLYSVALTGRLLPVLAVRDDLIADEEAATSGHAGTEPEEDGD